VQHVWQIHVIRKQRLPGEQPGVFISLNAFAKKLCPSHEKLLAANYANYLLDLATRL
jgi:hypothetical protein